ncbi:PAS domain-containing sensor histidine kinase [Microvirga terrestris]|uniref:Blue-light-activated histidine kinase n=1 Tax=Microvirga terrestris TaxID=2791024 RepID=A0ABS0HMV0_9HYPH|nr:HWE histidine kinase domain-containing protein [Microvirga terrestris]MBF9194812.1 PAS domain S-box protein [Microvirga terrestris]
MSADLLEGQSPPLTAREDLRVPAASAAVPWLQGGGEMGQCIRAHDWASTSLGPLLSWPQCLRTIADLMLNSQQPVFILWGADLTFLYNDSFGPILGPKHPAALGKSFSEVWPETCDRETWDRQRTIIQSALSGEAQDAAEHSPSSGERLGWPIGGFTFSWAPVRNEAGKVAGIYCSGNEVVGRAPMEEHLRQVKEAARIGSFEFDRETGKAIASPEYLELYGLPDDRSDSFSYEQWFGLLHPEDRPWIESETRKAVIDPACRQLEYDFRIIRADTGEMRWVKARTKLIRDADGRFIRSLGAQWDITAAKDAETALRESEERYRSFITHSSEGIWLLEFSPPLDTSLPVEEQVELAYRNGRFVDCNDAMARMYGLARAEDLIGKTLEFPLPSSDPEARAYLAGIVSSGYSVSGVESVEQDATGNFKYFDNSMIPVIEDSQLKRLWGIQRDITDRKKAEEQRTLLINELNHRVKNTLATVQSIASQTLRNAPTMQDAKEAFEGRLMALARVHDVLTTENWEGAELRNIVAQALAPYRSFGEDRLRIEGPEIRLSPRIALALSMALQELTTNAVKHGALSNATGRVDIVWNIARAEPGGRLHLRWQESGGPLVQAPARQGFGSRLIERSLARELNGDVQITFHPEGVLCTVDAPLA